MDVHETATEDCEVDDNTIARGTVNFEYGEATTSDEKRQLIKNRLNCCDHARRIQDFAILCDEIKDAMKTGY